MYPTFLSEQTIHPLLKQIPRNEAKFIAAELGIDPQLLSSKGALAPNDKKQALFAQAFAVATYLEKHHPDQIGTIDGPRRYVRGTLTMFSHMLYNRADKPGFAYFGGTTPHTILGLSGPSNAICVPTQTEIANKNGSRLASTLPFLLEVCASDLEIHATRFYMDDPAINLSLAFYSMRALSDNGQPAIRYSFFAKVKLDSAYVKADLQPSKHILLASPLYIVQEWKA